MPEPDNQLIAEFNARRSEEAFAALVRQHVNLVFATAFRQAGDLGAAEEITQNVFVALAQSSGKLGSHPTIAGWLYQTTLNKSREWLRTELRRRRRVQTAVELELARKEGNSVWSSIVPLLDEALLELREPDRLAVILHYMEGKSFREVGSVLGIGEDAARKRVDRCLDQLTGFFRRRGFAVPALAAGAPLFTLSSPAAPARLAFSVTATGLTAAHSTATTSTLTLIKGALKIMAWTNAKTAIVVGLAIALTAGTGALLYEKAAAFHRQPPAVPPAPGPQAAGNPPVQLGAVLANPWNRVLTDDHNRAQIAELRRTKWPAERRLMEEKIKSRQQKDETINAITIDLTPYLNAKLSEGPLGPKGDDSDNLGEVPAGVHIFGGVPFDVQGSIHLMGGWLAHYQKTYPEAVRDIRIDRRCLRIHLLHGASLISFEMFGTTIAKLALHYEDGSSRQLEIVAGKQALDWWAPLFSTGVSPMNLQTAPGTEPAWTGGNPMIKRVQRDESLLLCRTTFDNPQPDLKVTSIDYVSTLTPTVPFLLGMTLE